MLNIDAITADVGLDMSFDSLLGRADQLVKMEADALQDRKTHIYNLQRKLKSMKEQLESKDLHLDLLRKKVKRLKRKSTFFLFGEINLKIALFSFRSLVLKNVCSVNQS